LTTRSGESHFRTKTSAEEATGHRASFYSRRKSSTAAAIPHADPQQLLDAARDAITDGISVAYYVCGGVMVAAAIGAWAILRHAEYADGGPAPHLVPPHPPELRQVAGR
jgi:hypothetical protein